MINPINNAAGVPLLKNTKNFKIVVCLLTTYISFGLVYYTIAVALESFPPILLSCFRFLVVGVIYLIWSFFVIKNRTVPKFSDIRVMIVVAIGMMVIKGGCLIYSEVFAPSSFIAVLLGSTPMWMVIFGWLFFKENRPLPITTVGLIGGFIGIVLLALSAAKADDDNPHMLYGLVLIMISIIGGTLGSLFSKNEKTRLPVITAFGYQMLFASLIFLIIAYFTGEVGRFDFRDVTLRSWISFGTLVGAGSLAGFSAYLWLLYNTNSGVSTSYTYIEPIIAVIIGVSVGGEKLSFSLVTGCILIGVSVYIIILRRDNWRRASS